MIIRKVFYSNVYTGDRWRSSEFKVNGLFLNKYILDRPLSITFLSSSSDIHRIVLLFRGLYLCK